MSEYHLRQQHKSIDDQNVIKELILSQKHLTMAMSKDNVPYISTVNYYYDSENKFFYFHCSPEGKKINYLRSNPVVWGQIMEDGGYIDGECDHAYRTVHFKGKTEFLESKDEKIVALTAMMKQLEDSPTEERLNNIKNRDLDKVAIGKITVDGMSCKKNES